MPKMLIIQNITYEAPGLIGEILQKKNIDFSVIDLHAGDVLPDEKPQILLVLGGPDSANDQTEKMRNEIRFVKECVDAGIPCFGICLGLQVLVRALGGKVVKSPLKEIGFRDPLGKPYTIEKTKEGEKDPLLSGIPDSFQAFQLHGETVELTRDMTLLGTGVHCHNQIVRVRENAYGVQFHTELTSAMFEEWCEKDADLLKLSRDTLERDWELMKHRHEKTCKKMFGNFLEIAELL